MVKDINKIKFMNAGLGNRDTYYKDHAVFVDRGCIVFCIKERNDEHHLVMQCPALQDARSAIKVGPGSTISQTLDRFCGTFAPTDSYACLRLFSGQQLSMTRTDYIYRGLALIKLVDTFFLLWSERIGKTITRRPG